MTSSWSMSETMRISREHFRHRSGSASHTFLIIPAFSRANYAKSKAFYYGASNRSVTVTDVMRTDHVELA